MGQGTITADACSLLTWNLTLYMEFNLCNWQMLQVTFFLSSSSSSPYFLMYWSDKCKKDSTLSPADERNTIQNYWVCVSYVMPWECKQVRKTSGLINCFVDRISTGSQSHLHTDWHMFWHLRFSQWLSQGFMYSQDMNLISLGQWFHASSRIMMPSACRVHQSGKNRTAGSLKTKALQSFQMSGTTQHWKTWIPMIFSADLVGGYFAPKSITRLACAAYCYPRCWL